MGYMVLVGAIFCSLLVLVGIAAFVSGCDNYDDEEWGVQKKYRPHFIAGSALTSLAAAYGAWVSYSYLFTEHQYVLINFGLWYAMGFGSRFIVLMKRGAVLHLRFATDWDQVVGALFLAVFGPVVTVHMIYVLLYEKNHR